MAFPHGFMFQQLQENNEHHLPPCPPQLFHGGGAAGTVMKRSMSYSGSEKMTSNQEDAMGEEDLSDDGSHMLGEKKKRLNLEQVKALERSFELGNKLEPERKVQLAKALGLQPRQVAIWFQNRRARWKTKQLERDYESLKKQFESLKADNDALHAQNKKLSDELLALKNKDPTLIELNMRRSEGDQGSWSNGSDSTGSDINLDMSTPRVASIKHLFPPATRTTNSSSIAMTQFLHGHHGLKLDLDHHPAHGQMGQEEGFCNMFNGVDEQTPAEFWPWPEPRQNFN